MQSFSETEAVAAMNRWGKERKPFLFVVSYDRQTTCMQPLESLSPEECLYDFRGRTNVVSEASPGITGFRWATDRPSTEAYRKSFDRVMAGLLRGDSYLVNLTCRIALHTDLSLLDIFHLARAPYRLWMKGKMVCFSPESFVTIRGRRISSFPMKGTIDATLPDAEKLLLADEKEAAEHATIVDLIRNDLSMVADDVEVARYRYTDCIETRQGAILQTSSEIAGTLADNWHERIGDILFSQLPAGSITGAPKKRTVEIIAEAEHYDRGFYTGVTGLFDGRGLDSAVMIRFVDVDADGMWYKAGGGITARSDRDREYREILEKIYVPLR